MKNSARERLIEFFELNRILGMEHAILYDIDSCDNDIFQVIKYYQSIGYISKYIIDNFRVN